MFWNISMEIFENFFFMIPLSDASKSKNVSGDTKIPSESCSTTPQHAYFLAIFFEEKSNFSSLRAKKTKFSSARTSGFRRPKLLNSKNVSGESLALSKTPKIIKIAWVVPEIFFKTVSVIWIIEITIPSRNALPPLMQETIVQFKTQYNDQMQAD